MGSKCPECELQASDKAISCPTLRLSTKANIGLCRNRGIGAIYE